MEALALSYITITLFLIGGVIAGFIDSIAGGGGLITLPLLSIALGPGVAAIGSNKIVGAVGALTALLVYARNGHLEWRRGIGFVVSICLGSYTGSLISPLLPTAVIRWFLISACPILLWVVWRKNSWIPTAATFTEKKEQPSMFNTTTLIAGLICGFYDGAFGPGGGTFMLLALLYFTDLAIFPALATSKLANTVSASTSLVSYAHQGFVHWSLGTLVACGMLGGALLGSKLNLKNADKILRPMLAVAVFLLLARLLQDALA